MGMQQVYRLLGLGLPLVTVLAPNPGSSFTASQPDRPEPAMGTEVAQRWDGRQDFFEQGDRQFNQEIQRLQSPQSDPLLSVDSGTQWQAIASASGGFSVWMPPGVLSQETRTLDTAAGTLAFEVLVSQVDQTRYVVAYTKPWNRGQPSDQILLAIRDRLIRNSQNYQLESDRPISLGQVTGREFVLQGAGETRLFRFYLGRDRVYGIGVRQPGDRAQTQTATTFLNSFRLMETQS